MRLKGPHGTTFFLCKVGIPIRSSERFKESMS